jgi:replicative DNA helicase
MLLGGPNTIEAVTNLIGPSAYYRPGHADIHQAIVDTATEHGTIDLHIVASRMRNTGSDIEGRYLLELQGAAPAISTAATTPEPSPASKPTGASSTPSPTPKPPP